MSDRIKGLTVTLRDGIRDDDAEPIINAIRMLKGVLDVRPHVADASHHFAITVAKQNIRESIIHILNP